MRYRLCLAGLIVGLGGIAAPTLAQEEDGSVIAAAYDVIIVPRQGGASRSRVWTGQGWVPLAPDARRPWAQAWRDRPLGSGWRDRRAAPQAGFAYDGQYRRSDPRWVPYSGYAPRWRADTGRHYADRRY